MLNYTLKCLKTDDEFNDDYTLHYTDNALIQAEYKKEFEPLDEKVFGDISTGYQLKKSSSQVAGTVTYHAKELGEHLRIVKPLDCISRILAGERMAMSYRFIQRHGSSSYNSEDERPLLQRDDLCISRQYSKGIYSFLRRR